ncbi:MAG TPA: hypothetical protein VEM95_07620, partial [Thermoplasmata archaeon]|nr:hypothetical protein [Thermoplasmata archaeon]
SEDQDTDDQVIIAGIVGVVVAGIVFVVGGLLGFLSVATAALVSILVILFLLALFVSWRAPIRARGGFAVAAAVIAFTLLGLLSWWMHVDSAAALFSVSALAGAAYLWVRDRLRRPS